MNSKEVMATVSKELAVALAIPIEEIDVDENLLAMGITSIEAIKVLNAIRQNIDCAEISPVAIFEHQTVRDLSEYILEAAKKKS